MEHLKELEKIHQKERKYRHYKHLMGVSKHMIDFYVNQGADLLCDTLENRHGSKLEENYRDALQNDQRNYISYEKISVLTSNPKILLFFLGFININPCFSIHLDGDFINKYLN